MAGRAVAACAGFAPVLLMLAHNLVFGGRWILATHASAIPENLYASPVVYARAMASLFTLQFKSPDVAVVARQVTEWLIGDGGRPLLAFGALLVWASWYWGGRAVVAAVVGEARRFETAVLASMMIGMQLPLLFYAPSGRYAFLAGQLAFLLLIDFTVRLADLQNVPWPPRVARRWVARTFSPVTP